MTPSARPTYSSSSASQAHRRLFLTDECQGRVRLHGIARVVPSGRTAARAESLANVTKPHKLGKQENTKPVADVRRCEEVGRALT
jgi:hypothetical protein